MLSLPPEPSFYNAGVSALSGPRFGRFLFIVYVLEAGSFLALAPWSRFWLRRVVARSPSGVREALMSPYFRSFLVAVGLVHLFFAMREIEVWRRESASRRLAAGSPQPESPGVP